ncbi:MAG: prepilin-type N-terminal cleavage/methylation domain-containing protein [Gemmatimonadaceae bacterium]
MSRRADVAMRARRGFTIAEVIVALVVLSVGLLGLAGGTSLAARMAGDGAKGSAAATFAARRLERLRLGACSSRADGADTLYRGGAVAAVNSWVFSDAGGNTYHVRLSTTYAGAPNRTRSFVTEEAFSCLP